MIQAGAADEQVALYDPQTGRPAGAAPRSVVRRDNLPHGATAVLVRRTDGQVFVHRRSDGKDLWPGWHDCAAGGVIRPGEDPAAAAGRELAEELGVPVAVPGAAPGAVLTPLLATWYRDDETWYRAFAYELVWDGPVSFDDGEVAAGWWQPVRALRERLTEPGWPFVPDTRRLLELLPDWPDEGAGLQVLAGVRDGVDRATRLAAVLALDDGADVDDPLALLARDPGPVVRVRGVR